MELYFAAMAFYKCYPDFKSLVASEEGQPQPSLMFYLYKVFSFQLDQGLSKSDAVTEITAIRNNFWAFLYKVHAVTGQIDEFQTPFVSDEFWMPSYCPFHSSKFELIGLDAVPSFPQLPSTSHKLWMCRVLFSLHSRGVEMSALFWDVSSTAQAIPKASRMESI